MGLDKDTIMFRKTVRSYTPFRSEIKDVSGYYQFSKKTALNQKQPPITDPVESGVLLREVFSSKEAINKLTVTENGGLVSCCKEDCEVRIWDPCTLDLYGVLYLSGN